MVVRAHDQEGKVSLPTQSGDAEIAGGAARGALEREELMALGARISLATIYNTLNQFTAAKLLREVAIEGARTYFDTNTADQFHFYVDSEGKLIGIAFQTRDLVEQH